MKRLSILLFVAAMTSIMAAQTAQEEIKANKFLAASNYLDYERQLSDKPLTPSPKGYEPFYMSHYGRHGSRWLTGKTSYTSVAEPLRKAKQYGKVPKSVGATSPTLVNDSIMALHVGWSATSLKFSRRRMYRLMPAQQWSSVVFSR